MTNPNVYKEIQVPSKVQFADDDLNPQESITVEIDLEDVTGAPPDEVQEVQPVAVEDKPVIKHEHKGRAQKRIKQLLTDKQEAYRIIEVERAKNLELQKQLMTGNKHTKESLKNRLESNISSLNGQLISAMTSGDPGETVRLQDEVINAKMELASVLADLNMNHQPQATESPRQPAQQEISERASEWIEEHPEFYTDRKFHASALTVNNQLLREGFHPESDEFYEELDVRLSKRYPQMFGVEDETGVNLKGNQSSQSDSVKQVQRDVKQPEVQKPLQARTTEQVVSGSSRSPQNVAQSRKSQTVTLSPADIRQAEEWGIDMLTMAKRIAHNEKNKRMDGYVPIMITKDKE